MPLFLAEGFTLVVRPTAASLHEATLDTLQALCEAPSAHELFKPVALLGQDLAALQLLAQAQAQRDGISAGLMVDQSAGFVWRLVDACIDSPLQRGGRQGSPLSAHTWVWSLARSKALEPIAVGAPRLRLAYRTAQALDRTLTYRPEWITAWIQGRSAGAQADAWAQNLPVFLPEALRQGLALSPVLGAMHPLEALQSAIAHALSAGAQALTELRSRLPVRAVVVFGLNPMPEPMQVVLALLGQVIPVRVLGIDPSLEFWEDARSARARTISQWVASDEQERIEVQPWILGSWGQEQRRSIVAWRSMVERFSGIEDRVESLRSNARRSLLACLQHEIVTGDSAAWDSAGADRDGSLELHCAPSAWRQVEALASRLQQAFQQDASLRPEDCLVLCVEPQVFANPLASVMQAQGWPCCWIAAGSDPAQAEHEQVQRSLLGVLQVSLADPRASELSQLLQDPGLRCALGVERASWPQIASVLDDLAAMRIAAATEALVLGMAAPSEASGGLVPWGASWAYTKAQSQPDAARAVLNLLDRLQSIRAWLLELPERSVEQWADGCLALLDRWPNDALAPWSIETLERFRQKLAELKVSSQHDGTRQSQPLLLDIQAWDWCVRSLLPASRGPLIRGHGLHVSAFGNLRSLPYRIIAVLGAQDGALPRSGRRDPFDPLGVTWQLCDPDPICADRAAWLEALLAAGDAFWVFRTDRDLHRGQAIGPSVLIDELMTFLSQRDPRLVSSISVEHGLVPTATANPVEPTRVELPQPPEQASSLPTVSLGQLSRDLKRPIRRWWKVRYGVYWPSTWVDPEDSLAADAPDPVLEQWLWFRWPDATSDHRLDRWPRLVHPLGGGSLAYEWRHALARDFKALNQLGWQLERPLMAGVALELEGVRLMLAPQPVVHAGSSSGLLLRAAPDKKWEAVLLEASLTHCARAVHGASAMTTSLLVHDGKVQMASTDLATAAGLLQSAISAWAGNGPEPAWPCFPVWWEGAKAKEENRVQAARNRWAGKGDKRAAERDRLEWRGLAQRPDLEQVLEASETLYRPLIGLWQAL